MEEWRDIPDYAGLYQVSNLGRVRSVDRQTSKRKGRLLKLNTHPRTFYPYVSIGKDGTFTSRHVHRLVAEAFLPNPDEKPCVDHIDRNRANNVVGNLRWVTHSQNQQNREENTLDEMYIRQIFVVNGTKDGVAVKRHFRTLAEAKDFRHTVWGL